MVSTNQTCDKCGKTSCDSKCSSNESASTIKDITEDLCTTKSREQIEAEAEVFKKMDAFKKISAVKELETGYEFVYENVDNNLAMELAEFLKLEIKCCPTYDYALVVNAKAKSIRYQRFGSQKIKDELKEYFQLIGLVQ